MFKYVSQADADVGAGVPSEVGIYLLDQTTLRNGQDRDEGQMKAAEPQCELSSHSEDVHGYVCVSECFPHCFLDLTQIHISPR